MLINLIVITIFGLAIGSFISAYTYRYSVGLSVGKGRSFCPNCKATIAWYDNIPIISFLLLKGRCRSCQREISTRYPLIELSTGIVFGVLYYFQGQCVLGIPTFFNTSPSCYWSGLLGIFTLPFLMIIFGSLIAIFVIDFENQIIPDYLVFHLIILIIGLLVLFAPGLLFIRLVSGFAFSLFLLLTHLATKGKGMGLGDVKFAILAGLLLGWPEALSWMFLSFIIGAIIGIFLIIIGKARLGKHIPFGPFLIIALFIVFVLGDILQTGLYLN